MALLQFIQKKLYFIYKYLRHFFPTVLDEIFTVKETIPYDLRMRNELYPTNPKTVMYGTETMSFIPKIVKDSSSSYYVLKRALENGNTTAHVVYAKHFCIMLLLHRSTGVLILSL